MQAHDRERMELSHEPVEGYPRTFHITLAVGVLYLMLIFSGVFK